MNFDQYRSQYRSTKRIFLSQQNLNCLSGSASRMSHTNFTPTSLPERRDSASTRRESHSFTKTQYLHASVCMSTCVLKGYCMSICAINEGLTYDICAINGGMPEKVAGWVWAEGPGRGARQFLREPERDRESWREAGRKEMTQARECERASERAKEI